MKDMHNQKLLEEWSIYIAQCQAELQQYMNVDSNAVEPFDIITDIGTIDVLITAFGGAYSLRALDVPVSSADA
jgi:hypothetical protein